MDQEYATICINSIDLDMQHPSFSSEKAVERHAKSVQAIEDGFKKMEKANLKAGIVFPVVVCKQRWAEGTPGRYWLVDGWGRITVALDALHQDKIQAMILPPMSLGERVRLRLELNT